MLRVAVESSIVSEAWKQNGGIAMEVSPEELTMENSVVTFEAEEARREFEHHLFETASEMGEDRMLMYKDGRYLVERLRQHKCESEQSQE
jgi:hypothetical protein